MHKTGIVTRARLLLAPAIALLAGLALAGPARAGHLGGVLHNLPEAERDSRAATKLSGAERAAPVTCATAARDQFLAGTVLREAAGGKQDARDGRDGTKSGLHECPPVEVVLARATAIRHD